MKSDVIILKENINDELTEISPEKFVSSIQDINSYSLNIEIAKKKVEEITKKAKEEKAEADKIKTKAENIEKAKKWHSNTNTVNGLVETVKDLAPTTYKMAETQGIFAETQKDTMDALKKVFENQENLAKVTSWMIWVSTLSLANAKFMATRLEELLNGASKEPISEMARSELMSIAKQIHFQQDVHETRERQYKDLKERIAVTEKALYQQMESDIKTVKRITDQERLCKEYSRLLELHSKKNEEHNKKFTDIYENVGKITDKLTVIEQLNLEEYLSNQQERLELLENIINDVKNENKHIKKTLFWYKILVPLSIVLSIIGFFIK